MKIKVLAEIVKYPGGQAVKGDIADVPDKAGAYFVKHGYAEKYTESLNTKKITKKKVFRKKAKNDLE